jgi:hypothetical protein
MLLTADVRPPDVWHLERDLAHCAWHYPCLCNPKVLPGHSSHLRQKYGQHSQGVSREESNNPLLQRQKIPKIVRRTFASAASAEPVAPGLLVTWRGGKCQQEEQAEQQTKSEGASSVNCLLNAAEHFGASSRRHRQKLACLLRASRAASSTSAARSAPT